MCARKGSLRYSARCGQFERGASSCKTAVQDRLQQSHLRSGGADDEAHSGIVPSCKASSSTALQHLSDLAKTNILRPFDIIENTCLPEAEIVSGQAKP